MKIVSVTEEHIQFDNGTEITFEHEQDCCEWNYADFKQLDSLAREYDYSEQLVFEVVNGSGFKFGDSRSMFFVPCYSQQNGSYSDDLDILYNGKEVLNVECEWERRWS